MAKIKQPRKLSGVIPSERKQHLFTKYFFFGQAGWNMAGATAPQTASWTCPRKFVISWAFPTFLH